MSWQQSADEIWGLHAERFYRNIYSAGKCKYCGKAITSHLDVCSCPSMISARAAYKKSLGLNLVAVPAAVAVPVKDNPNKFIEPDTFDISQEERISPAIEEDVPF